MADSAIEWTDKTWNPVTGCTRVSAGCDHCYAVGMTARLEHMGQSAKYAGLTVLNGRGDRHFNGVVRTHDDTLAIPLKWQKPARIFVNSMSDLFHRDVPFEFIDRVFAAMAMCPQHTFQVLTKRPERMAEYLTTLRGDAPCRWVVPYYEAGGKDAITLDRAVGWHRNGLPNVWLGTSVEDQPTADQRIPHLLRCPAAVRFLSMEPLLGPVKLVTGVGERGWDFLHGWKSADVAGPAFPEGANTSRIDWVIVGGESGPNARPMHPDWARSLRDQCAAAGVPFFFKQWGEWSPTASAPKDRRRYGVMRLDGSFRSAVDCRDRDFVPMVADHGGHVVVRVGKSAAGRLLDGVEHNATPLTSREVSK